MAQGAKPGEGGELPGYKVIDTYCLVSIPLQLSSYLVHVATVTRTCVHLCTSPSTFVAVLI